MPELEHPLPQAPERKTGWAVVGLGDFAVNYILPAIGDTQRCRVTALVSGNAEKARQIAEAYGVPSGSVYSYDTFDRIRENPDVDVVYVILPNALHREYTVRAFEAGKHVFCEKPMAVTVEECQAMIDAGRRADRKLMVAYRSKFEAHMLRAAELIRQGEIGTPQRMTGTHGRILDLQVLRDQWRAQQDLAGGGSLYDIGLYNLVAARVLLGEEPTEVNATGFVLEDPRPEISVETSIGWTMKFPSGAAAVFDSSYRHEDTKRVAVNGSEAALELDPATNYYGNRLRLNKGERTEEYSFPDENQFAAEMDHFAECVQEGREPRAPGEEGMRDVAVMQAIYQSAREGRPVQLPA